MDYQNQDYYIPPKKLDILDDTATKHKVFGYARVSTDKDDQRNSLVSQKRFFDMLKSEHENWISFELFTDEGISGTSLNRRDGFNEMIRRAKAGEADLIVTKEVSRFSRNLKDTVNIIDELDKMKIGVYFINNRIYSRDESEYRQLCAISNAAQEESYNISDRVKFGQRMQMQRGVTFGRREMFGYRIHRDSDTLEQRYEIIEEEAEVIRKIFDWFVAGDGTHRIARRLEEQGTPTFRYSNGWSNTVILRLLRNEKYVGDLCQGKTYTPKMLDHKKKYNRGESFSCYLKNHHEPIVARDIWDKAQEILNEKTPPEEQKIKHSNRYWLSGKIFCGVCKNRYVSCTKKKKNCVHKSWVCFEAHTRGKYKEDTVDGIPRGCNSGGMINDRVFKEAIHDILQHYIIKNKDILINNILKSQQAKIESIPKKAVDKRKIKDKIDKLNQRIDSMYIDKLDGKCPADRFDRLEKQWQEEISQLEKELKKSEDVELEKKDIRNETDKILKKIEYLVSLKNSDFNEDLYGRITKKIIVYPCHIIEIYLYDFEKPFFLQFTATGRLEKYTVSFTVLTKDEAFEIIGDKINNKV
ncbi:MAG: recombinase family protein [Acutalibacteraceae bacterium]